MTRHPRTKSRLSQFRQFRARIVLRWKMPPGWGICTESARDRGVGEELPEALTTKNLVERIRQHEVAAQEEFVNRYQRPIVLIATARTRDPEAALDLCQDVLMAVLAAIKGDRIREPEKLDAFVQGTARNLINNFLCTRTQRRETHLDSIDILGEDPTDKLEAEERKRLVRREINNFKALDQKILLLSLVDGHTLADVAERLGLSHEAVRARKSRMVRKIVKIFKIASHK